MSLKERIYMEAKGRAAKMTENELRRARSADTEVLFRGISREAHVLQLAAGMDFLDGAAEEVGEILSRLNALYAAIVTINSSKTTEVTGNVFDFDGSGASGDRRGVRSSDSDGDGNLGGGGIDDGGCATVAHAFDGDGGSRGFTGAGIGPADSFAAGDGI